jgi:poly-gamma-glutamate synthesis protein (capsule biosynthesis protein)
MREERTHSRRSALLMMAAAVAGCSADPKSGGNTEPVLPGPGQSSVPSSAAKTASGSAPGEVVLTFAGDVHFTERTTKLLDKPDTAFGPIADLFTSSDIAVANLESAITLRGTAEPKRYHFRAGPAAYDAFRAAGLDLASQGNNHALDYGQVGLADSIEAAHAEQMPIIGAGHTASDAFAPWITEANGTKIAFIGISQVHELESTWAATDSRPGVAHTRDQARAVAAVKAAKTKADFVVVFMHWGKEGQASPTDEMRSFAKAMAGAGADLISGTHAHLLLGDGWLGNTFVSYGLGNFLWWLDDAYSNDTGVLRVTLRDHKIAKTEFVPAFIDRTTGQPMPVTGAEEKRIVAKYAALRAKTGLADAPKG